MVNTILEIVLIGLKFLERADQDKIRKEILELRTQYATELAKPENQIDDALLDSISAHLVRILSLYRSAIEGTNPPNQQG